MENGCKEIVTVTIKEEMKATGTLPNTKDGLKVCDAGLFSVRRG